MKRKSIAEDHPVPARRPKNQRALMWHAGSFVIINVFFWLLDAMGPGSVNWAYWITAPWAFALAFHVLAYLVDGRIQDQAHKPPPDS